MLGTYIPTISLPDLRFRTGWLVSGTVLVYLGQRFVRRLSQTGEFRPVDGGALLLAGLLCLVVWVWHNRTALSVNPRLSDRVDIPETLLPNVATWCVAVGLTGLAALAQLMGAGEETLTWLAVVILLGLVVLGQFHRGGQLRSITTEPSWLPQQAWVGVLLAIAAAVTRLLFVAPVEPDFELVSASGSLTGLLYRLVGPERAILIGFVASCLVPVVVWRAGCALGWSLAGLGAAVMAVLSPGLIWESPWASASVLSPLLITCVIWSAVRCTRSNQTPSYWNLGIWMSLAWMEGDLWPGSWFHALLACGALVQILKSPSGGTERLHRGVAWAIGLMLPSVILVLVAPAPWKPLVLPWDPWSVLPEPMVLANLLFRPHSGWMPWFLTVLTPLEACLGLIGLVITLASWRAQPLLALSGLGWLLGLLFTASDGEVFVAMHRGTLVVPLLLCVPSLALGLQRTAQWLDQIGGRLPDIQLIQLFFVVTAAQLPGLLLGANPIEMIVDQFRLGDMDSGSAAEQVLVNEPTTAQLKVHEAIALDQIWSHGGSCALGRSLGSPRGVVIDSASGFLYATSVDPPTVTKFDLATGEVQDTWDNDQLAAPVDMDIDSKGRLLVLDNLKQQVFVLAEVETGWEVFSKGSTHFSPRGMHVTTDGYVMVADTGHSRVTVFDTNGHFLDEYSAWTTGTELDQPSDVVTNASGIWVTAPDLAMLLEVQHNLRIEGFKPVHHHVWAPFG